MKIFTSLALLSVLNTACSLLPDGGIAPKKIALSPPLVWAKQAAKSTVGISIERPTSDGDLDSQTVRLRQKNYILSPVGHILWSDNLPDLLHRQLLLAFEHAGTFLNVSGTSHPIKTSMCITTNILTFDIQETDGSYYFTAHFIVKVIDQDKGSIKAIKEFKTTKRLDDLSSSGFAVTCNGSLAGLLHQITDWSTKIVLDRDQVNKYPIIKN